MKQFLKASDIFDNEELVKFESNKTPISLKEDRYSYLNDYSKEDILNNKYYVKSCYSANDRDKYEYIFTIISKQLNNELKNYSLFKKLSAVLSISDYRVINYKDKTLIKLSLKVGHSPVNGVQSLSYDTTEIINNKFSITLKSYFKPELIFSKNRYDEYYIYLSYPSLFSLITALKKQLQSQLVTITEFFEKHQTFFKTMFNDYHQLVVYQHMLDYLFSDKTNNEVGLIKNLFLLNNATDDNKEYYQLISKNIRSNIKLDTEQIQNVWQKLQPLMNKYHFKLNSYVPYVCHNGQLKMTHNVGIFSDLKKTYHCYLEAKHNHSDYFGCYLDSPKDYNWNTYFKEQFEDYYRNSALTLD